MAEHETVLSPLERATLEFGRFTNERPIPKRLQTAFLRAVTKTWVYPAIGPRVYVDNVEWFANLEPDRGVVIVSNHRSFFDLYIVMLVLFNYHADWIERVSFPVRANFFYETRLGAVMNLLISGYSMYPPLYRDRNKAALNKDSVERIVQSLQTPGTLVGLHPEGTRNKGTDPYTLLPAQPGVGQIVLQAKPLVVPLFVNGLPNDIRLGIAATYEPNARRDNPVIVTFGEPLDYAEFTKKKPRAALYKRCADKMNQAILSLSDHERELRAACANGDIDDEHPNWLRNHMRGFRPSWKH